MKKRLLLKRGPLLIGVFGLLLASSAPFLYAASNPISVESLTVETKPVEYRFAAQSNEAVYQAPIEDNTNVSTLPAGEVHYQMQILQQEVQELRGLVEELSYALKQLQRSQDARY